MPKHRIVTALAMMTLLVTGALCCALYAQQTGQRLSSNPPGSGRYQIVFSPLLRADTFMIDTETGRSWKPITYTDLVGNPTVWEFQDKVDNPQELTRWFSEHRAKPK